MKCRCAEILQLFSDLELKSELERRQLERERKERDERKRINEELAKLPQ